ncbi:MAG: hypothetical protein BMS9Abin28_1142 [Anaerolineae bacterium]|nr:MAG: hypothetical protein BMS9Abin28_1142 [Anaerolineae bacterium]
MELAVPEFDPERGLGRAQGEILPRGSIAVDSVMTIPDPPTARVPKCTQCQSVGIDSGVLNWLIGDVMMRLREFTSRSSNGSSDRTLWFRFGFGSAASGTTISIR